ncbi:MAG TPA: DUF222 domain-containing protein [Pseudonocardia sp.]|uniref:HNH endonuclease signature motif containing protein n=1 Tax=Pseudonocardia sp. TaxID=60912 RepID=UPI002F3E54B3
MVNTGELPPGLADLPAGPGLAAALAGIDTAQVSDYDRPVVALARRRQMTHHQALVLAESRELGRRAGPAAGGPRRLSQPSQWADGEVAALYTCSERAARAELDFAEQVITQMPQVFEAMLAGWLDRSKVWVFADCLHDLLPEYQDALCAALVEPAVGWTPGKLANRLRRMILELDPGWAARRYRATVRERGVTAYLNDAGTMTVTGQGLTPDEAAAAMARIDDLAAAIRRAGHPNPLHRIRADVYVALLDGGLNGLTRDQIITTMLRRGVRPEDTDIPDTDTDTATGALQRPSHVTQGSDNRDRADPEPAATEPAATEPAATELAAGGAAEGGADTGGEPVTGVEIRVGLAALLGVDQRCGQLAGFDYVLPETARRSVAKQYRGAEWRFAVTDSEGRVVFGGLTRRRPHLPAARPPGRCRGGVVELHISAELLTTLTSRDTGTLPAVYTRWAPVLADIAAQYADRARLLAQLEARPRGRFSHAGLARFLCIRDRTCVWPGCRRSATGCHIDHTQDHADGGPTIQANTAPLCARHHLYKSAGAWKLRQTRPGVFEWTSPMGRVYRTQAEPLKPPAPSIPRPRPSTPPQSPPAKPATRPANDPDPPPF